MNCNLVCRLIVFSSLLFALEDLRCLRASVIPPVLQGMLKTTSPLFIMLGYYSWDLYDRSGDFGPITASWNIDNLPSSAAKYTLCSYTLS